MQTDKNYIYGSTAPKLEYNVYEENSVLKEKKQYRSNRKAKFKVVVASLFIFAACLLLMYRYAVITEMNYNIAKEYKTYNALRNENSRIKVQIEKELDLDKIKQIAVEKLGMKKPDKMQIVYYSVPKYDVTVVLDSPKSDIEPAGGMMTLLVKRVGKLISFLY